MNRHKLQELMDSQKIWNNLIIKLINDHKFIQDTFEKYLNIYILFINILL
jgi:hypothetical protein